MAKSLKATPLTHLMSGDVTAVSIQYTEGGLKKEVVLASVYLPYDAVGGPPSTEMVRLVEWCERKHLPLILGCDANAHHVSWGSQTCNVRGTALMEYLVTTDLEIANRGHEPTFFAAGRQTVIDLTLISGDITQDVSGWHVSQEVSLSDHRHICFSFGMRPPAPVYRRNPRSTDWPKYVGRLEGLVGGRMVQLLTEEQIEEEVDTLETAIITAYERACPLRKLRSGMRVPWWSSELTKIRKESRRLLRYALQVNTGESWASYRTAQREYKRLLRVAKRSSWRSFCASAETVPEAARLQKILRDNSVVQVGMLQLPSGAYTECREEALAHLLETHFPGCVQLGDDAGPDSPLPRGRVWPGGGWRFAERIISKERVEWAIRSFSSFKAAGPDMIFPALLQHGSDILSSLLCTVFRACLALGYVPRSWRKALVVFIPKAGRPSYMVAKAFRSISLTSFLLKAMERLIDRYIRDELLVGRPLHANQHAYVAGRSTETALHSLVTQIEMALSDRHYALVVFFDIEGAFDNATFESMETALQGRGAHPAVTQWVGRLLRCRTVQASLGDCVGKVAVHKGTPQGGVLSPLMWDLVVDSLLRVLHGSGVFALGYSDDGVVLVKGLHLDVLCGLMQTALDSVQQWCQQHGLSVNPQKTELVLFTRRRVVQGFRAPSFYGRELTLSPQVKYLGVILDSKLN
ncbi:MAG: RNA-directed DNA polymerase [Gammaproteobacteria bacterium]|nr:RNA-directed DNA polymerase [Gammaproteobacteria bacterium]